MTPETISVARILHLRVPIGWQEAVEVTVGARAVAAADRKRITLEGCLLSTTGVVELGSATASRDAGMSPLQLLRALLDGQQAPAELRALAMSEDSQGRATAGNGTTGPTDLSWFALPNGAEEIARLAVRALATAAEEGTRSALDRLRSEASNQPAPEAAKPRTSRRLGRWAGLGLAGVAATGAFWVATRDDEKQWTTAGADLLASAAALITSSPAAADVTALASAPKPETPRIPAARVLRPSSTPALRVSQVGDPYLHAENGSLTPADESAVTPPSDGHEAAAPPEGERASAPVPVESVFSAADMSVEPPTLVYPQLRSEPSVESEPVPSTIELTVDPSGRVVRVRLDPGRPPTVHDRMLVSAAKTWQFKPAMRDGQPVTYLLRVPVTR
jgi:TonB family protein